MKKEYIPIVIMGSLGVVLIGIGFYFRKQIKSVTQAAIDFLFSDNITYHINQLNPAVKLKFAQFIDKIQKMGYKVQVNSSYRPFKRQAEIKYDEKDPSHDPNAATPGYSLHNYGLALDLQVSKNGITYGKSTSDALWLSTGIPQLAKSMGMRWGGDAFGSYQDAVHFDIEVKPTATLLSMAQKQFGTTDPNKIIGNQLNLAA